jgi:hypothetical protein
MIAVTVAFPLMVVAWVFDVLATACVFAFGLYWTIAMRLILSQDQRRAHADRWATFANEWTLKNPGSPWSPRIVAFAATAAATVE